VKPGYNQTEIGVIPVEWDRVAIGDIATIKGGKRLPAGYALVETPTPHPYLRVSDMIPGGVDVSAIKYVPKEAFPFIQNYRIFAKDIFISVAGTLGIIGVVPQELDGANLTENADRLTELRCDRDYLMYWLLSRPLQQMIESIRTVGAQPKLALGRIAQFEIALPRAAIEQRAIAAALSDVDALLHGLDRLIIKKRDLRQAATQQLVNGRTRLPGYVDSWAVMSLDEIARRATGVWGKNEPDERNVRSVEVIRAGDISSDGKLCGTAPRYLSVAELDKARCDFQDVVITTSGNGLGKTWWCDGRARLAASNFVRVLRPDAGKVLGLCAQNR
jgi:type I restriction enzyme, S subunit